MSQVVCYRSGDERGGMNLEKEEVKIGILSTYFLGQSGLDAKGIKISIVNKIIVL